MNSKQKEPLDLRLARKGYISLSTAADKVGLTVNQIGRLAKDGKLDSVRVGKKWYVSLASLIRHVGPKAAELLGLRAAS